MVANSIEFPNKNTYFINSKIPDGLIHWSQARNYIDKKVRVYGEVVDTYFNWREYERLIGFPELNPTPPPTFLEIGVSHPNMEMLRVVIWGRDRGKFNRPPDEQFKDKTVILTGKPYFYKGIVHIQVSNPEDIVETERIEGLYIDYMDPDFDELCLKNTAVLPLAIAESEKKRRDLDDWDNPELYEPEPVYNEWGDEVHVRSIPGTDITMYFDEDNGWMVE